MSDQPDIYLYPAATMNARKPIIVLEEARAEYALPHSRFSMRERKSDVRTKAD